MSVEEALVAHLASAAGLTALIDGRIYPVQLPQTVALPALTYQRISRTPTQHRSSRRAQHSRGRFQFDVWAPSYAATNGVKSALLDAMAEFRQASAPRVDVALLKDDRDAFEAEPSRWRSIVDYYIWSTEE